MLDRRSTAVTPLPPAGGTAQAARVFSLGLLLVVAAGASVGLCVGFLRLVEPEGLWLANRAAPAERTFMFICLAAGAGAGLLASAVCVLFRGGPLHADGIARLGLLGDRVAPLCLSALLPMLFAYRAWNGHPLIYLVLLAAAVLLAESLFGRFVAALPDFVTIGLRQRRGATPVRVLGPTVVVVLGALAYAAYFSHYTLLHHRRFGTAAFDLGINVNWCFNALHGQFFRAPVLFGPDGGSMLAGHAIFAVFLWLPFFALWPGPEVLLIYQSVMVGLAAVPLYFFARTQMSRWSAALVALAYLLYAPLHGPNFYDFHELPVALPWYFLLYFLIATGRLRLAACVVPIIWAHREDLAVGLAFLGAFLFVSGARPRFGATLAISSTIWFVVDKFVIMPAFGSWWFASIYKDLAPAGAAGYGPIVQTILINPAYFLSTLLTQQKLIYVLHLFAPLAFLPARRPLLALLSFPGFFFTVMTTGYAPTVSIAFQYTAHWIPCLFGAVPLALRHLQRCKGVATSRGALCALLLGVVSHSTVYGAVFQHESFIGGFTKIAFVESRNEKRDYAGFTKLVRAIPDDASVAATEQELSHVAARLDAYTLRSAHGDADYLLIRKGGSMTPDVVQKAFERNDYGLLTQSRNTFFLFKKGHHSSETARAMSVLRIRVPARKPSDPAD
jgi:uncharacterized membrane protein